MDAIYRSLRENTAVTWSDYSGARSYRRVITTWEFPVLAKYWLPGLTPRLRPFLATGPSFRIPQTVSHLGITAGFGLDIRLAKLNLAPSLRYTHWQSDNSGAIRNTAALFVGFSF